MRIKIDCMSIMFLLNALAFDLAETATTTTTASSSNSGISTSDSNSEVHQIATNGYDNSNAINNSIDTAFNKLNNGFANDMGDFLSNTFGDWTFGFEHCAHWQPPHSLYFQLANALLFIAFLAPHGSYGLLCARCALVLASILMTLWGYCVECTVDVVVWSGSFLVINVVYLTVLLYQLRPIRFDQEIEAVYISLFKPLKVTRHQFKKILNCMKLIRSLKYQEVYAQEKVTKVDSLSLVLSGKLVVSQNQRALHIVFHHQFLDSPEWFGVSTDDYFQVSIMAMEESRVLIWHRDKLKLSIITEPFLQTVFDHILGRDVVKKLMQVTQVSETMAAGNGFVHSGGYDDGEDKPMLFMKKNGTDGHGITALINRQLQDEHAPLLGRHQSKPYMIQKQSAFSAHRSNSETKTSPC